MSLGYLTNHYPKVSHTFIRREILALEAQGFSIERFSIRSSPEALTDPEDIAEARRTCVLFDMNRVALLLGALSVALTRPLRCLRALRLALRLGRASERGVPILDTPG